MADFRRFIPALAVLALLVGLMPTASAQIALTCNATVVPPTIRAEGLTELVGDIVLSCSGGLPLAAGQLPTANISVFLNAPVTSRLTGGVTNGAEVELLIDDPAAGLQYPCIGVLGSTTGGANCGQSGNALGTEFKAATAANVYQGAVSGSSITFIGVPIDPPGTSGTRNFRITNVRVNATAVAPGGSGTPGQVVALVSASPATIGVTGQTGTLSINNSQVTVGFVSKSLQFNVVQGNNATGPAVPVAIRQCSSFASSATTSSVILQYVELFPTAFKTRTTNQIPITPSPGPAKGIQANTSPAAVPQAVPGFIYNTETGFYNPALPAPYTNAGLADNGTRLKAVFNNIPAGVNVWVSTNNIMNGGVVNQAQLTGSEYGAFFLVPPTDTADFGDTFYAGGATPAVQIPVVSGSATAVWEVNASSALATDTFDFGVWFTSTAAVATNSPLPGTGTVNGGYGTVYTSATGGVASSTLQIPRFVDTSAATNVFVVSVCRTSILFPFVTNQAGFDTGLAVSNTTVDPFGTAAQAGTCTLNFYGASAPSPVTSASVAGGTSYVALTSSIAPGFQGYVIAVCNFQLGHGFAFVSDMGAQRLAMGYLGIVLPDPPRQGTGVTLTGGSGEILGN